MRAGKAAVGRGFASYEDFFMHFDGMRLIACGFRLVTSWPQGGKVPIHVITSRRSFLKVEHM